MVAAIALFASWGAGWWDGVDEVVFRYFNAQLSQAGFVQTLWAITNWRPFDLVAALFIAIFALLWLRDSGDTQKKVAQFLAFCALLLIAKVCEYIISDLIGYRRQSPTLVFADATRLSELVTWIQVKDRGSTVFPGDHAFVIFATAGFFLLHARRVMGIAATIVLIPFVLPRIAAGAHWLTDVVVGGLTMALILLAVGYATPFAAAIAHTLERRAAPLLSLCVTLGKKLRLLN